MATDLQTRPALSKPDAFLQRKFHELSARIRRVDRLTHVLALGLVLLTYALVRGWFDWFVGHSQANWVAPTRWLGFLFFAGVFAVLLVRAIRGWFRQVNPYYVAHLLEATVPEAKNGLINWLDLHDEKLPIAFQKHLSARAAEQWEEGDTEQTVRQRKNWSLMSAFALPIVGLLVLIALSPSSAFGWLLSAFAPFFTPANTPRTQITLVAPQGDVEVGPTQSITFTATIAGNIPAAHRPDAPKLHYRYQTSEDYFTQPLHQDDAGRWSTQLLANQLRTGFTYKLSAGDDETPEHRVKVRGRAHVKRFEIDYEQRPYLQAHRSKSVFPNDASARPIVNGLRGAKVAATFSATRPVREARIEFTSAKGKSVPCTVLPNDTASFTCRWTLEESGQFRVVFTTTDGEENVDRDWYPLDVRTDEAPTVVLTQPAKDVEAPVNGFIELAGRASDDIGIKTITLHVRAVNGPERFAPRPYRPEKSFQREDGTNPDALDYQEVLLLDQLKNENGTIILPPAGRVLEYWLEATDNADYPNANVGKSAAYKITLMPPAKDAALKSKQQAALKRQKDHQQKQDAQAKDQRKNNAAASNTEQQLDQAKKDKESIEQKIKQAANQEDGKGPGESKGAEPPNSGTKEGPQNNPDSPDAKQKDPSIGDSGTQKPGGKGSGAAKDGGDKKKPDSSPGDSKPSPKQADSGAKGGDKKDAGDAKGDENDAPPQQPPRDDTATKDAATPGAKKGDSSSQPQQGDAKGLEQNGPDIPKDDPRNATPPPDSRAKGGKAPDDAGNAKQGDGGSEQARDVPPSQDRRNPGYDDLIKMHAQLQKAGLEGESAAKALAEIGKTADDPRKREAVQEALAQNGRDPKTGDKVKGKNPAGTLGQSTGLSDEAKAGIANREFAAKIGQLQLDDWKKRMTPDLLRKAGMTEAEWHAYLKSMQTHDALVRQLNAELLRKGAKMLTNSKGQSGGGLVENATTTNDVSERFITVPPPEINDASKRFNQRKRN